MLAVELTSLKLYSAGYWAKTITTALVDVFH